MGYLFRVDKMQISITVISLGRSEFVRSPRRPHLRDAGDRTLAMEIVSVHESDVDVEPFNTVRKAFSSYGDIDSLFSQPISRCLEHLSTSWPCILETGRPSAGLYTIESGILACIRCEFPNVMQDFRSLWSRLRSRRSQTSQEIRR